MSISKPILVIGQSGRAIVKSARLAGIRSYVMDNYADIDTRGITLGVKKIPALSNDKFNRNIVSMLDDYCDLDVAGVVIGSGFEDKLDIYYQVEKRFNLLGNVPETVKKIKDPWQFFPELQKLGIKYPPTSVKKPKNKSVWLAKKTGGYGGSHIKPANYDVQDNYYFQKFINGRTVSAVFLAYKNQATLLGISEIWCRNAANKNFAYTGAVTLDLSESPFPGKIDEIINLITREFGLIGLCGIDCIIDEFNQIYVLEVNPRPPATFELHESDTSIIGLHINACSGIKDSHVTKRQRLVRAHKIIYADSNFVVPDFIWPEWIVDRPCPGLLISKGDPVCSIVAEHNSHEQIIRLLQHREQLLINNLGVKLIAA